MAQDYEYTDVDGDTLTVGPHPTNRTMIFTIQEGNETTTVYIPEKESTKLCKFLEKEFEEFNYIVGDQVVFADGSTGTVIGIHEDYVWVDSNKFDMPISVRPDEISLDV